MSTVANRIDQRSAPLVKASPADTPSKAAKAGIQMAVATLAMAAASGLQAVLYLSSFGVNARTDAFFAAFALYAVSGIFSQSIRLTSVPLLVGENCLRGRDFAVTLVLMAIPVLLICELLATPLAGLLAPGTHGAARAVTVDGLRILGGAIVLQLGAAGAATLLGLWDRFSAVAMAYMVGAASGLVAFLAVKHVAGVLSLGWSMLAMAVTTFLWMAFTLARATVDRRPGGVRTVTSLAVSAGLILGRTFVYFVVNGLYMVTLAFATHASAGKATMLSYAYLFCSYLVAGTSVAVGISRIPDLVRGASQDQWKGVVADTVPHGYRYAVLVAAPALAGLIAAGAALVGAALPHSFTHGDVETLRTFALLLLPWTLAALMLNLVLPALFAVGRARLVNMISIVVVVVHVTVTIVAYDLWGVDGVVGAFWIAPMGMAIVLLRIGAGEQAGAAEREILGDTARFVLIAAACFAVAALVALPIHSLLLRSLLAAALGGGAYLLAVRMVAPQLLAVLLGARRATAPTTS
jgi:peptidoglycan biosynthesis protein MviN/MurJ (putative lipid II flippase)